MILPSLSTLLTIAPLVSLLNSLGSERELNSFGTPSYQLVRKSSIPFGEYVGSLNLHNLAFLAPWRFKCFIPICSTVTGPRPR